ncbi:MAG: hypothetical protein KU37_02775 [Sulfuricurvum sp. PC08-66]|nr:MAG: hypothetical protein KU37_02775 [Sulfuricurvum sp. PC08-66]
MQSIRFIEEALKALDGEVEQLLFHAKLGQNERDELMLPIAQQKRILTQTLEDLRYLRDHPPVSSGCKAGAIRHAQESGH